jgi:hypothetical protein
MRTLEASYACLLKNESSVSFSREEPGQHWRQRGYRIASFNLRSTSHIAHSPSVLSLSWKRDIRARISDRESCSRVG